jgi:hypothetical protein
MPPTSNLDNDNFIKSINNYTNIVFFNGYISGFISGFITGSALTFIIMTKKLNYK